MRKQWVPLGLAAAIISVGGLGTSYALAQSATGADTQPSIIQRLADRFGLKSDDVQKVFDEDREAHKTEMDAKLNQNLDQLVADGKLTAAQKQAILDKRAELQAQFGAQDGDRAAWQNLTPDQRKAKLQELKTEMQARKADLESWAKANNIDTQYLRLLGMGHRGFGHGRGHGMMPPM